MAKNKKNKNKKPVLSPKQYIKTNMRKLPYYVCLANEGWESPDMVELVTVIISKKFQSGKIAYATYLVDRACLGLKNTICVLSATEEQFQDAVEEFGSNSGGALAEISVEDAHNLIYGAIDYAEELGFSPEPGWAITQYFLDEELITDGIDKIKFGKNGKPFFFAGPYDNAKKVLETLRKNVGEGNFHYVVRADFLDD